MAATVTTTAPLDLPGVEQLPDGASDTVTAIPSPHRRGHVGHPRRRHRRRPEGPRRRHRPLRQRHLRGRPPPPSPSRSPRATPRSTATRAVKPGYILGSVNHEGSGFTLTAGATKVDPGRLRGRPRQLDALRQRGRHARRPPALPRRHQRQGQHGGRQRRPVRHRGQADRHRRRRPQRGVQDPGDQGRHAPRRRPPGGQGHGDHLQPRHRQDRRRSPAWAASRPRSSSTPAPPTP